MRSLCQADFEAEEQYSEEQEGCDMSNNGDRDKAEDTEEAEDHRVAAPAADLHLGSSRKVVS